MQNENKTAEPLRAKRIITPPPAPYSFITGDYGFGMVDFRRKTYRHFLIIDGEGRELTINFDTSEATAIQTRKQGYGLDEFSCFWHSQALLSMIAFSGNPKEHQLIVELLNPAGPPEKLSEEAQRDLEELHLLQCYVKTGSEDVMKNLNTGRGFPADYLLKTREVIMESFAAMTAGHTVYVPEAGLVKIVKQ